MGWVSTAIADEVSTAVTSAWIVPFARAIPSARSRALVMLWPRLPGWRRRPRFRARPCRGTSASRRTAARPGSARQPVRRRARQLTATSPSRARAAPATHWSRRAGRRSASPARSRGFYQRIKARRGHSIAIVASARKLACLFWCLLTRGEDYAFAAALADRQEDAPPRAHRRRPALPGRPRRLVDQRRDAPRRTRARPPSPTRLRAHRQRLASTKNGRERDTGPRIKWLLEGASRAADPKAQVCALTRRHSRPTQLSHDRRCADQPHLTFSVRESAGRAVASGAVGRSSGWRRADSLTFCRPVV